MCWPALRAIGVTAVVVTTAACGPSGTGSAGMPAPATAPWSPESVQAWRDKHEADYTRDYVSIAGLHPLREGRSTAGSAPDNTVVLPSSTPARLGTFIRAGQAVIFEPERGVPLRLRTTRTGSDPTERPLTAPTPLKDDGTPGMDEVLVGDVRLVIHASGDSRAVRVRDPNGPLARDFRGFTWFDIDSRFRVMGRFIPDQTPRKLKVLNTYGEVDEYATEGVVEFTWEGQHVTLRPFTTRPKRLYFVFRDASSGQETYEAARFLYADLNDDGSVALDFNTAYNPPCAFNPYTTCPIPLPENRLSVKILAGERAYPVKVPLPGAAPN
jgi:uncharacterized protein (DUF1684 family)